jgi:hypothetical protein
VIEAVRGALQARCRIVASRFSGRIVPKRFRA